MIDLFGEAPVQTLPTGKHYTRPMGYRAMPGTGPVGETCGSCAHLAKVRMSRSYPKCGLMRPVWTHGRGTDVLVRSPACSVWEAAA